MLATQADRERLFLRAGRQIVENAKRYYEHDDASVLSLSIYSAEGGLGDIALNGCVVKIAGVDEEVYVFEVPAKVFESQEATVAGIPGDDVEEGAVKSGTA